jgi:hypothetical protein
MKRKHYRNAVKLEIVKNCLVWCKTSGHHVSEFADLNGISRQSLYKWRRQLAPYIDLEDLPENFKNSMRIPYNDLPLVPIGEKQYCSAPSNSKEITNTKYDGSATLLPVESGTKEVATHFKMDNPVISIQTSYATINLNDKCSKELMINLLSSLKEVN